MPNKERHNTSATERYLHQKVRRRLLEDDPNRLICKLSMLGMYGKAGYPDLLIMEAKADAWFIELKVPGRDLSTRQRAMHGRLRKLGFDVYTIRDMDELELLL